MTKISSQTPISANPTPNTLFWKFLNPPSESNQSGFLRRWWLQKGGIFNSAVPQECLSLPIGDKLIERLRGMNGDRLRLDGLIHPGLAAAAPAPSPRYDSGISVEDTRKLLRVWQLQMVPSALRGASASKSFVSYRELVEIVLGRVGSIPPYTAELSSNEAGCRLEPDLQSFEVTCCLLEMNQEMVKIILDCKEDFRKNQELFGLVEDNFENSLQTLDSCTALEKCLKRARYELLILQHALQQFLEEDADGKKYSRTLEELRNFKTAGEPFTGEFFQTFQFVYKKQVLMLEKLLLTESKIDKKLRHVKVWRKVSSIIFAGAFAAILICSVVTAALAAPPVAAALAAATSIPAGSMGKWFDSLWRDYEVALKGQKEVISLMQVGTSEAIMDLNSILVLLEIQIDSLSQSADFALRDEEAVKFGIEDIRKKLGVFMKSIEDLGEQAD